MKNILHSLSYYINISVITKHDHFNLIIKLASCKGPPATKSHLGGPNSDPSLLAVALKIAPKSKYRVGNDARWRKITKNSNFELFVILMLGMFSSNVSKSHQINKLFVFVTKMGDPTDRSYS